MSHGAIHKIKVASFLEHGVQNVTDDRQTDDRRHTVPRARLIVWSANQEGKTNLGLLEQPSKR